ncbi:diacylglycerol kinase [Oceanirhabdus sp. W0125-5]|uniref:diacylglycerol kinase n=1 Tax=Oceanirhabdus sp. W0125-5 TaxID=2999116 RepID=UPI0022F2FAAE|nr:diacylglycerol kinase [Oceanirhabdus sp. W0125-5]WBW95769.1 diacylglycerol kinase [Oceanirhabdus sp. W0125-5]
MKSRNLLESFNYAIKGIRWAFMNERNFKVHTVVSILVIILGIVFQISKVEFLITLLCIGMVLGGELINTAIEKLCDGITGEFKVYIKAAKDIAAGGVLITALISGIIGIIIFGNAILKHEKLSLEKLVGNQLYIITLIIVSLVIIIIILKICIGRGTPMQGGMPSGHSAIAFTIATIISLYSGAISVIILSYLLAIIVAECRVESGIHSIVEVSVGGILGILITIIILGLLTLV